MYLPTALEVSGQYAVLPVLPLLALQLGYGVSGAAAVSIIPGALALLGPMPVARLLEAVGPRTALIASGVLGATAGITASLIFAAEDGSGQTVMPRLVLLVAVLMLASVQQVWMLGRQSHLGIQLPAPLRARGMSLLGGTLRIGQVIGPLLGAAVIAMIDMTWVFALYGALALAATTCVVFMLVPHSGDGKRPTSLRRPRSSAPTSSRRRLDAMVRRRMAIVALGVAPIQMARVARPVVVPLVGASIGVDAAVVSIVFGISAAVEIMMVVPAGTMMENMGRTASVVRSSVLQAAGFLVLGISAVAVPGMGGAAAIAVLAIPSALMAVGNGYGAGLMMTLGVDLSPLVERTRYLVVEHAAGYWPVGGPGGGDCHHCGGARRVGSGSARGAAGRWGSVGRARHALAHPGPAARKDAVRSG